MADIRVVQDWKHIRFLPFIQCRTLGGFLSSGLPVDLVPWWNEYRWTPRKFSKAKQVETATP